MYIYLCDECEHVHTFYTEPTPGSCPVLEDDHDATICDVYECTDSCEDPGKLCCQNLCGSRLCVDGPCRRAVMNLTSGAERLDQFVPECSYDGTFHPLQCWSDHCWCVDKQSGENISNAVTSDRIDELDCLSELIYTQSKLHLHTQTRRNTDTHTHTHTHTHTRFMQAVSMVTRHMIMERCLPMVVGMVYIIVL